MLASGFDAADASAAQTRGHGGGERVCGDKNKQPANAAGCLLRFNSAAMDGRFLTLAIKDDGNKVIT
jgi:hypothetical protein